MALFYDNIYRIVPTNTKPDDSKDLRALLEDGAIGKSIDPTNYSIKASSEFLAKIDGWNAAALACDTVDKQKITKLHTDKIDKRVRELFREAGFEEKNNWMHVPTAIASNYILFLANAIASNNRLSLITGDWGAWTGTSYFGLDGQIDEYIENIGKDHYNINNPESFGLFSLMLKEFVPINISEIPSEKIVEFRIKRKDEISQFRLSMEELRLELASLDSLNIRIDVIRDKATRLAEAIADYKKSADVIKANGWFGVALMGFPAPLAFGQLFSIPTASAVILTSTALAIGGIFNICNTKEELRKLKRKTPASFLVEMKETFKDYTQARGGGDMNFHAYNCMEEYVND